MRITLTQNGVFLESVAHQLTSLDVHFSGIRIWSFVASAGANKRMYQWPEALEQRLYGSAEVEVKDSSSGEILDSRTLHFDDSGRRFRLEDPEGRPLMLNKWLRLAPMLASDDVHDRRDHLLENLIAMRDDLSNLGYRPFAVGGTALGPYRDGDFLAHDDDGDLAVFLDTDEPVDVARKMLLLERQLRELGYRVRVHSHAHLQVYPKANASDAMLYVDVFAAFLKDGNINQPFHVRGPFGRDQLLPFATVSVRGENFPVARDTEGWFVQNYGEDWRTPQPGWRIKTPRSTVRRFQKWFGSFNYHRHFWESYALDREFENDYQRTGDDPPDVALSSARILNIGSGVDPRLPESICTRGDNVLIDAFDYSDSMRQEAQKLVETEHLRNVRIHDVNFLNYHAMVEFVSRLPVEPFDIYVGFAAETQNRRRRRYVFWRLLRMALLSGGNVVIDYIKEPAETIDRKEPRTWHLEDKWVDHECGLHSLHPVLIGEGNVVVAGRTRKYSRARIYLDSDAKVELVGERSV